MKKTHFLAGLVLGILVCLAVCLVAGYMLFERFLSAQQNQNNYASNQPVNMQALQNAAGTTMPKTPQDALAALDKIIQLRPNDPQAYLQKADLLAETGDYQNALQAYNAALSLDPSNAQAYLNRSVAKFMMGDYEGAKQDLSYAIAINPDFAKAFYNRGVTNVNLNSFNNALGDFSKAMELFAKQGDKTSYTDALKAFDTVNNFVKAGGAAGPKQAAMKARGAAKELNVKSDNSSSQKNKSALTKSLGGDTKGMLEKFKNSMVRDGDGNLSLADMGASINSAAKQMKDKQGSAPKTILDYRADAQKALAKGDLKGAKQALDSAIDLNPKDSDLYAQRAAVSERMQDYKSAMQDYDAAIAANPNNAKAFYERSRVKSLLGNNKGAIADAQKASDIYGEQGNKQGQEQAQNMANTLSGKNVRSTKNDSIAQALLHEGTNAYNNGNYQDALTKFNEVIARQPNVPELYYNRAITNAALGKTDAALKDYRSAIAKNPNMPDSYIGAAGILMQNNKNDEANDYLQKAIALNPNNSKAYTMNGMLAANKQDADNALDNFNKAINLDDDDAAAHLYRGIVYGQKNDMSKSLQDIQKAKQLASAQNNLQLIKEAEKYEQMVKQSMAGK